MTDLIVLGFANRELADEARSRGAELDRDGVLDLSCAALAYRREDGEVELAQPLRWHPSEPPAARSPAACWASFYWRRCC